MLVALHKLTSLVLLAALGLRSHTAVGDDGDYKSWSPETKRQRSPIYRPSFGELTIPYLPAMTEPGFFFSWGELYTLTARGCRGRRAGDADEQGQRASGGSGPNDG